MTEEREVARASAAVMRRLDQGVVTLLRALVDVATMALAFVLSYQAYVRLIGAGTLDRGTVPSAVPYAAIGVAFSVTALAVFASLGLYQRRASVLNLWELQTVLKGVTLAAAFLFATLFLLHLEGFSRIVVAGSILLAMVLMLVERRVVSSLVGRLQLRGLLARRVLIYGAGPTGQLLMKKIVQAPQLGLQVLGFLDDTAPVGSTVSCRLSQTGPKVFETSVVGRGRQWREFVRELDVHEVLVTLPSAPRDRVREMMQHAREEGVRVGVIPQVEDLRADGVQVDDVSAIPVLRPFSRPSRRLYLVAKRAFDIAGALALLVLTAPVWLLAMWISVDSPGPILFVQERVGRDGRRFRMFKFRTMWRDVSPAAPSPHGDVDPRITRIGRILRVCGLDELPQLFNVLAGDMSLVGPRPEMPFIVDRYSALERQRLAATPGITGLWQVSADRHAEIHENLEYDLYYINHQSMTMDVLIIVETVFFTLGAGWRALTRRSEADAKPAAVASNGHGGGAPYVLVALDRRRRAETSRIWQRLIPAAHGISDRWPVKLLVAPESIEHVDAILEQRGRHDAPNGHRMEYVWCHEDGELRALVAGARLVVTELAHVMACARDANKPVVGVKHGRLVLGRRAGPTDPVVEALRAAITGPRAAGSETPIAFPAPRDAATPVAAPPLSIHPLGASAVGTSAAREVIEESSDR